MDTHKAPLLEAQGLTKAFAGLVAVDGVGLTLAPGEILGLIGPNGAGKTTMFNMLSGFAEPTSGTVRWDGEEVTALMPHEIAARGLARTFQHAQLFPDLSARENVVLGCHLHVLGSRRAALGALLRTPRYRRAEVAAREAADAALADVGLLHQADMPAGKLPHGDARKLGIAIALVRKPRALLLDEPAAGLNATESRDLLTRLREIASRDIGVIIVEHDMPLIMGLCQRLVVLNHGEKIFEGTTADAQRSDAVITAYLGEELTPA
jgi:ABC-type branched-subunit amino acid transport system ATPase component